MNDQSPSVRRPRVILWVPWTSLMLELLAIDFVDNSLGHVIVKLTAKKLINETLIIIASKHGQTPIDLTTLT